MKEIFHEFKRRISDEILKIVTNKGYENEADMVKCLEEGIMLLKGVRKAAGGFVLFCL